MVQPPALVGLLPIGRAIAPPSVELLVVRHEFAQRIDPGACGLSLGQLVDLDGRVAHNVEKRLVAPDVVFKRRDVEIADQDRSLGRRPLMPGPIHHFVDEGELMGELDINLGVRLVAARRDIKIVNFEPLRLAAQDDMEMTSVAFGAKVSLGEGGEGHARNDRDPVIALLSVDRYMGIACLTEGPKGEIRVGALRFLQAQDIRLVLEKKSHNEINAQAHRINVPCGDGKGHGRLRKRETATCPAGAGRASTVGLLPTAGYQRLWLPSWLAGRSSSM